jgi:hypothetical protein
MEIVSGGLDNHRAIFTDIFSALMRFDHQTHYIALYTNIATSDFSVRSVCPGCTMQTVQRHSKGTEKDGILTLDVAGRPSG